MTDERACALSTFYEEDRRITRDRLQQLRDEFGPFPTTNEPVVTWDKAIESALLELCEKDCLEVFATFYNLLDQGEPFDKIPCFLAEIQKRTRPIFEGDLVQYVFDFQQQHPITVQVFNDLNILDALAKLHRPTVGEGYLSTSSTSENMINKYGRALQRQKPRVVHPLNYLKWMIRNVDMWQ